LKFLSERAATIGGTSNPPHWGQAGVPNISVDFRS
jgi:hypothetical protein